MQGSYKSHLMTFVVGGLATALIIGLSPDNRAGNAAPHVELGTADTTTPEAPTTDFAELVKSIPKGQTARVPEWQWVTIERYDGERPDEDFDMCGIEFGGFVTAIGTLSQSDDRGTRHQVLVSYQAPSPDTKGTPCDGVEVFFLDAEDFLTMTARFEKTNAQKHQHEEVVETLLR